MRMGSLLAVLLAAPALRAQPDIQSFEVGEVKQAKQQSKTLKVHCLSAAADGFQKKTFAAHKDIDAYLAKNCPHTVRDLSFYQPNPIVNMAGWPGKCQNTYWALFEDQTNYDSIVTLNRFIVQSIRDELGAGIATVDKLSPRACSETVNSGTTARYMAWVDKKGVHLGMGVDVMSYQLQDSLGESQERAGKRAHEMFMALTQCTTEIANTWRRYGISMDMQLSLAYKASRTTKEERSPYPTSELDIFDFYGRSNSGTWHYGGQSDELKACIKDCRKKFSGDEEKLGGCVSEICMLPNKSQKLCLTLRHETGHLLSFPDEYSDSGCPLRKTVMPDEKPPSVMNESGVSEAEFHPRHILQVLDPLCR